MATWSELYDRVVADAPLANSPIHGVEHWARVAENGLSLILAGAPADATIVMLFALLHDSQRENEGDDPEHGPRAAEYALRLNLAGLIRLRDPLDFDTLFHAIHGHTFIRSRFSSTLGTCLDADRLDLPRVGILPDPRRLSTEQAIEIATKMSLDVQSNSCII